MQNLPAEFDFLVPTLEDLPELWISTEYDAYISSLSDSAIDRLRADYITLREGELAGRLCEWIDEPDQSPEERKARQPAFRLLFVFELLGEQGTAPFTDGTVRYFRELSPMDWSTLPEQLKFLCPAVEAYGCRIVDEGWDTFLATFSRTDLQALQSVSDQLKRENNLHAINEWISQQETPNDTAFSTDMLLGLLDNYDLL